MKFAMIENLNFLVVSTVRNVDRVLLKEFDNISKGLSNAKNVFYYFVESDSDDDTVLILNKIKYSHQNFNFISLGKLQDQISDRIERIRYCRNQYVSYIRENLVKHEWDYVLVLDLDGNCKRLNEKAISSCFDIQYEWDACFANQLFGYFDIYALRAENWVNHDCLLQTYLRKEEIRAEVTQLNWFKKFNVVDKIRKEEIYNHMHIIPFWKKWISVNSAFGGAGIYKTKLFTIADYTRSDLDNHLRCEHVDFHFNLIRNGYKSFFINPKFINLYLNEHVLYKLKIIRFLRYIKNSIY